MTNAITCGCYYPLYSVYKDFSWLNIVDQSTIVMNVRSFLRYEYR